MVWEDDWPIFNKGEPLRLQLEVPDGYLLDPPTAWRDDFTSPDMQLGWYRKSMRHCNDHAMISADTKHRYSNQSGLCSKGHAAASRALRRTVESFGSSSSDHVFAQANCASYSMVHPAQLSTDFRPDRSRHGCLVELPNIQQHRRAASS